MSYFDPTPAREQTRMPAQLPVRKVPSYIQESEQVANWLFYNGAGDVLFDFSGEENHGDLNGPTWIDGPFGWALDFDPDDYVAAPDDASLDFTDTDSFTVLVWVNHDSITSDGHDTYLEKGNHDGAGGDPNYQPKYSDAQGGLDFCYNDPAGAFNDVVDTSGFVPDLDTWYHIGFRPDTANDEVSFFVNGELKSTVSDPLDLATNSDKLYMGIRGSLDAEKLDGQIGSARIYIGTLGDDVIKAHYEETRALYGV